MGCGAQRPYIAGKRYLDWHLADPKGRPIDEVRAIRDDIAGRIQRLLAALDETASAATDEPAARREIQRVG